MPKNLPAKVNALTERSRTFIQDMIRNGVTIPSADAFGVHSEAESNRQLDEFRAQAGPEVWEAANAILSDPDFLEALREEEVEDDGYRDDDDEDLDDIDDLDDADAQEATTPRQREISANDRALVLTSAALAPRNQDGRAVALPPKSANWHRFTTIANPQVVKQLGAGLFGRFPCFADKLGRAGRGRYEQAFEGMNVVYKVVTPPNPQDADPQTRRLLGNRDLQRAARASQATASDVDRIGTWLRANALRLAANKMQFMQMTSYQPEVLFAVSEDETFLLVRETTQGGAPLDIQYIYSWPGGRNFYANHPEAVEELSALMNTPDGITIDLSVREARRIEAQASDKVRQTIAQQPAAPALTQTVTQTVPQAAQRAAEPVHRTTTTPAREPKAQEQAPVTPSAPKGVTPSQTRSTVAPVKTGRFAALLELQGAGFERKLVPAASGKSTEQVRCKEQDDGRFLTILSGEDGKALAGARIFRVELRDDVTQPGTEVGELQAAKGREGFFADLEEIIQNLPSGPRP